MEGPTILLIIMIRIPFGGILRGYPPGEFLRGFWGDPPGGLPWEVLLLY